MGGIVLLFALSLLIPIRSSRRTLSEKPNRENFILSSLLIIFVLIIQALDQSYQKKIGISKPQKHPEFMQ